MKVIMDCGGVLSIRSFKHYSRVCGPRLGLPAQGHLVEWAAPECYGPPVAQWQSLPALQEKQGSRLGPRVGRSPGGGHASLLHCSCLQSPVGGGPGGLQAVGWQRVGHG